MNEVKNNTMIVLKNVERVLNTMKKQIDISKNKKIPVNILFKSLCENSMSKELLTDILYELIKENFIKYDDKFLSFK